MQPNLCQGSASNPHAAPVMAVVTAGTGVVQTGRPHHLAWGLCTAQMAGRSPWGQVGHQIVGRRSGEGQREIEEETETGQGEVQT